MKVKITNKSLKSNFCKQISMITGIISFVFIFINFSDNTKVIIGILYLIVMVIIFISMWYRANKKITQNLFINGTNVKIKYGDIFNQEGIKVIAFNEFFDTQVDNRIISELSLNGRYILEYSQGKEYIDEMIDKEVHLQHSIVKRNVFRKQGGKKLKYRLGTVCPVDDYYLLSFAHFDENDRAFLSLEDYIICLMHMWNELDCFYAGKPINIPLLGSGITRFKDELVSEQELLNLIIRTYELSKIKFGGESSLTIVLNEKIMDKINLYDME